MEDIGLLSPAFAGLNLADGLFEAILPLRSDNPPAAFVGGFGLVATDFPDLSCFRTFPTAFLVGFLFSATFAATAGFLAAVFFATDLVFAVFLAVAFLADLSSFPADFGVDSRVEAFAALGSDEACLLPLIGVFFEVFK